MPLTPTELADAFAALGTGYGTEAKPVKARRMECVDLAALLAVSQGKVVAGARAPSVNAMKVWSKIQEGFAPTGASVSARARVVRSTAGRELVELVGCAAVKVIGRGEARLIVEGVEQRFISAAPIDDKGRVVVTAILVGDAQYQVPLMLAVDRQAALHKVAQPWALLGLRLGDVGHGHEAPAPAPSPAPVKAKPKTEAPQVAPAVK